MRASRVDQSLEDPHVFTHGHRFEGEGPERYLGKAKCRWCRCRQDSQAAKVLCKNITNVVEAVA